MSRVELHRGDHVVILEDRDVDAERLGATATRLLDQLGPAGSPGPALGFHSERRGEVDLEAVSPVSVRSEHG